MVIVREHSKTKDAQQVFAKLQDRYAHSQAATLARDVLEQEILEFRIDATWKKGCVPFLIAWKNKVMDLEALRDVGDPVTDHERRNWLNRSLLMHPQMRAAYGNLVSNELLNAMAQSTATAGTSTTKLLPFNDLYEYMLSQAHTIDAALKVTTKESRRLHETERNEQGRGRGQRDFGGRGFGRGRGRGRGSGVAYIAPETWAKMTFDERAEHHKKRQAAYAANKASTGPQTTPENAPGVTSPDATIVDRVPTDVMSVLTTPVAPAPPGSVIRNILSSNSKKKQTESVTTPDGKVYTREANNVTLKYQVRNYETILATGSLVDGGANGGLAGSDMRRIEMTLAKADVSGIADNDLKDLGIGTFAALIETTEGEIVGLFAQYADYGIGKSVHSSSQMRDFGLDVNDVSRRHHGGLQRIVTPEGHVIPLKIRNGLAYMDMRPPTDEELARTPQVMFTADIPWDPAKVDDEYDDWGDLPDPPEDNFIYVDHGLTDTGDEIFLDRDQEIDRLCRSVEFMIEDHEREHTVTNMNIKQRNAKAAALRPNFGWLSTERIMRTLAATTQFYRASSRLPLRKHFKTRFPAANVNRLDETVATDTFFSDTPAHDDGIMGHGGATMIQLYVGKTSQRTEGFPMQTESQMPGTLEDFIRKVGAPNVLFSDNAKVQIGAKVRNILRHYSIKDQQCEPHHQHQNYAERRIQEVAHLTNTIMDRTGTPAEYWLLAILFVIFLLNHMAVESLQWETPIRVSTGQKPDISAFLQFRWWEPVYYQTGGSKFSTSKEALGRFVGIAEHQGDVLTYLILTDDTLQVITRSSVRSALGAEDTNWRASTDAGEDGNGGDGKAIVMSTNDIAAIAMEPSDLSLPEFSPDELLGQTYLKDMENGQRMRAKVSRKIMDTDAENHQKIKFLIEIGEGAFDEIIAYNELSDLIEKRNQEEEEYGNAGWAFKAITGHVGPISSSHQDYKGSSYNIKVLWEDNSETFEPLVEMIKDDPVSCAVYAKENDLLDTPGWKSLKRIARREKKFNRMVQQATMLSQRNAVVYKFGIRLPRSRAEAFAFDATNGVTKWQDAIKLELDQLDEYDTFIDKGKQAHGPQGFKRINCHFVFDCKQDLRHKARLVAGGHMTAPPRDSVYSGVVSLRSMRIVALLAELNGLEMQAADVGNAYLEALTSEKVYFVAGPEFGERAGHTLVIYKALYGLRTSGARWGEKFADTLRLEGFFPCRADPCVWMRDAGDIWEYICIYVDDLATCLKDPDAFFKVLTGPKYKYKLKGVGPIKYHLGGDFGRDEDGTLSWGSKTYVKRMLKNYEQMFGEPPKEFLTPLDKDDHPELDMTPELDIDGIKKYQSLIGALQWAVSIGRFDIAVHVMTLGRYRAAPHKGHLERLQRIYGYLKKYNDAAIRFRTGIPDYSEQDAKYVSQTWEYSVYGNVQEEIPSDMPETKGQPVRLTCFWDANLMHDLTTGRSCTGILHMINQTPIDWYAKRQATVETATYGSEFVAGRTATEQVIDIRYTLRMMGVKIDGPTYMFGDNQSVITSSTIPHSMLGKRHNMLSYHRCREAIAAGISKMFHMDGKQNPSDVMTKFLAHSVSYPLVKYFLFWKGHIEDGA
jgi:hypothetical protein